MFRARALSCLDAADDAGCVWGAVDDLLLRLDVVLPDDFGGYDPSGQGWGSQWWDDDDPFDGFDDSFDWLDGNDGSDGSGFDGFDDFDNSDWSDFDDFGDIIASYPVTNSVLVGNAPAEHGAIWARFTELIPAAYRQMVAEFEVFTDGRDGNLAAVGPLDDPTQWVLSIDPADAVDPDELTASLVHEFGHLLTLNNEQVPALPADLAPFAYDQAAIACSTYFSFEGCSHDDAYINVFVARFWADIIDEFNALAELDQFSDRFWDGLDEFERKYGDRFVTEYAMTDPAEDIAESFMVFVLEDRPGGASIADQKVLFFYEYPELVSLRATIRAAR